MKIEKGGIGSSQVLNVLLGFTGPERFSLMLDGTIQQVICTDP